MWQKLQQVWGVKDIRNKVLYVLGMLVIFRLVAHIPIPGVNLENLRQFLAGNQIFGLLDVFSGGTMSNFSIVMLGVGPYITSSIIFQLLAMIVPKLEELSKEGESGQQKINTYTRLLTVPLAFLQSYGMIKLLNNSSLPIITDLSFFRLFTIMMTITAGTMFLMWIGELISEQKVGNGISLLIFAGIAAGLPGGLRTVLINYDSSQFFTFVLFAAAAVLTVVGVVFINQGQRNIPVTYAKQVVGNRMQGGSSTHLPLRVSMAGVIPIIFAISLMVFPTLLAQFFAQANTAWIANLAVNINNLFQNQIFYGVLYFLLVFGFTYFYTAVIFHPQKMAENLQKQGGFIPGIRPGLETEKYLGQTMNRVNLTGALFLGVIAILPILVQYLMGTQNLAIGGASLLIVVSVAIETAKQIDAQITMHAYDTV